MDALFPTVQPPHFSYWEIERHFSNIDLLVVGSGIVGLTTAIFCKQRQPEMRITVLERGGLPSGASTKNAGFACFGSLSELLADLRLQPTEAVFGRTIERIIGLQTLRSLLGDKAIGFESCGGFELFTNEQDKLFISCVELLREANKWLSEHIGTSRTYDVKNDAIADFGFRGVNRVIVNHGEGAIDTGRMMEALVMKARETGVNILTGMGIQTLDDYGTGVQVILDNGHTVRCGRVHVATNGFARQLIPELDVNPARAQVLITAPIAGLRVRGTFHLEEGYYYFRNVGNRLLLGGGRNLDFETETTSETGLTPKIQGRLQQLLNEVILPGTDCPIAHRWSGVMGVGGTKDVITKRVSERISCSVRMGGMGVALGTLVGKKSAELILG
jgi:glycine/D-amino acid oxidase-like deaminating enzyme